MRAAALSICRIQWLDMRDCVPIQERQERYEVKLARLVEALEQDRLDFEGVQSRLLHRLEPLPFDADIAQHLARFTGRRWVFDRIDAWLADPNAQRVFWIVGRPGVGKTAISCWLCSHRREIAAFYLCCHGHAQKSDLRRCVLSIAYQLSTQLPDYQTRLSALNLEKIVPESNARTLFDQLIVQPLSESFPEPDRPVGLLIDALDEATEGGKNELAALIASEFEKTPGWLRLILTSRPDPGVEFYLPALIPYRLDSAPENGDDLRAYLSRELKPHAPDGNVPPSIIDAIVARSEGIFLYVYVEWFCRELDQGRLSLDRPDEFPLGLGGIYARMCERQFADLGSYENDIRPALEVVSAAQEPMEAKMIASTLGWNEYRQEGFCRSVAALFPIADGRIQPFHASLMKWLTDAHRAGRYFVSVREGHQRLADSGWRQYQGGVAALSGYMRSHLPAHLGKAERWGDLETILADPNFVEARCEAGRTFDLVADVAAAARAGRPLERISAALVEVFQTKRTEGFRQQLRSALNQFFGPYSDWPQALKTRLEESDHFNILLFLGDTLDMEVRYEEAERVFRRMLVITDPADAPGHSTACVRLAMVLDHQGRREEGLRLLDDLVSQPGAKERYAESYWWAQYHRGIFLRQLHRYDDAKAVLESLRSGGGGKGLATSALHQLGTIDMELGELDQAEEKFQRCLAERGEDEHDQRRAFEHRRLGQVHARKGRFEEAQAAFNEAIAISVRCGNWRYVGQTREDTVEFLAAPYLKRELPEKITLSEMDSRFNLDEAHLARAFRLLHEGHGGYVVEVMDAGAVRPTGQPVYWDIAHKEGYWHASVAVLVVDSQGNLALQQRGETDSKGRWDSSVAGHQDIGESDLSAAVRETREELGIVVNPERLTRLGKPYGFRKVGTPSVTRDGHESPTSYQYRTDKTNCERVSVFILRLSEEEKKQIVTGDQEAARSVR